MSETGSSASGETTLTALRPAEVAERLGISAATLRRWSSRFGEFLELGEGGQDGGTHRRYSAADVATWWRRPSRSCWNKGGPTNRWPIDCLKAQWMLRLARRWASRWRLYRLNAEPGLPRK